MNKTIIICALLAGTMRHAWGMEELHVPDQLMQEAQKRDRENGVQQRLAAKMQRTKPIHYDGSENNVLVEFKSAITAAQEQILARLEDVDRRLAKLEVKVALYEQNFQN